MAGWEEVLAEAAAVWDALAVAAMVRVPEIDLRATLGRARRRACMVNEGSGGEERRRDDEEGSLLEQIRKRSQALGGTGFARC